MIECKLCGKEFKVITWGHLKFSHNMTLTEYKEMFGVETFDSLETRTGKSESHLGVKRKPFTKKHCLNISKSHKQYCDSLSSEEMAELIYRVNSPEAKAKMDILRKDPNVRHKISLAKKGVKNSPAHVQSQREFWASLSPEKKKATLRKMRRGIKSPTRLEIRLQKCLDKYFPGEWRFNGRRQEGVVIGRRIPDFVNVNGKKAVVELFSTYWHEGDSVEAKIAHYAKYGFKCAVIWEDELEDEEKVIRFVREGCL